MRRQNLNIQKNQTGLVSIIVTMIIMVILSLIVIGFARITRREQRQALDRQLSTQAYYAAETGINDTIKAIKDKIVDPTVEYTKKCDAVINLPGFPSNKLDGTNTSYTCLFVDPSPLSLEYNNIDTNSSRIVPITAKDGGTVDTISIGWQAKDGKTDLTNCANPNPTNLPPNAPAPGWQCDIGIMRVDLIPSASGLTRDNMVNNSMTVYLYPSSNSAASVGIPYEKGFGTQGRIAGVKCAAGTGPRFCNFEISGLGQTGYMLRIKSIYKPSSATITANRAGAALELKGAQAIIDSTGKANDVLRRILVRVPLANFNAPYPEFAVQAVDTLCKRFAVATPAIYLPDGSDPKCDIRN